MEQRPFFVSGLVILSLFVYGTLVIPQASETFFNSSNVVAAVAGSAPTITTQPTNSSVPDQVWGRNFNVNVTATGSNLHYQWFRNGVAIPGSDYYMYYVGGATVADAGTYYVVVSNDSGSVTSSTVTVTVDGAASSAPVITSQPSNWVVPSTTSGRQLDIKVGATGSNLSYRWYHNGVAIVGYNANEFYLANAAVADAGTYYVVISNVGGTVTSNTVTVTVDGSTTGIATPTIAPAALSVAAPANGASVSGSFRVSGQTGSNWVNVTGFTSAMSKVCSDVTPSANAFTIVCDSTRLPNGNQTISIYAYSVAAGLSGGSSVNVPVTVNVNNTVTTVTPTPVTPTPISPTPTPIVTGPSITTQPAGQTRNVGETISLSVVAAGTSPLSYQWLKNGAAIVNQIASALSIQNAQTSDAGSYAVRVTNSVSSVTSNAVTVAVNTSAPAPVPPAAVAPSITTQPSAQTLTVGGTISLSVGASGTSPLTFQWYKETIALTGQTGASLSITNAQTGNSGSYSVRITNSAGTVTSNSVAVTVNAVAVVSGGAAPTITTQPLANTPHNTATAVSALAGNDYLYIFLATTGTAPLSYQWYHNGVAAAGQTSATVWYSPVSINETGTWYVVVSNAYGSVTSNSITATVSQATIVAPTISSLTSSQTASVGSVASFSVSANGTSPFAYQWYKNGTAISGQTTSGLVFGSVQSSDAGTYRVVVTNGAGSVTSANTTLTVSTSVTTGGTTGTNMPLAGACGSCDHLAGVQSFQSILGRKEAYVLAWGWANTVNNFIYSAQYIDEEWPKDQYKLEWDMPMIVQGTTFQDAINGTYDYAYTAWAQRILARDPYALVRIGHEQNGNWYDWSQDGPAGSAAKFAEAYRHIVTVMRRTAPNLKFVFNPGAGKWAGIDWTTTYPGDAYVDYISYDMYEDGPYLPADPVARWQHFLDNDGLGLNFLASFAAQHGKPMAFDEWGTNIDDGTFIANMYTWMTTHNVAYQMYWDSNAAFSGKLVNQPTNLAVFKATFGR